MSDQYYENTIAHLDERIAELEAKLAEIRSEENIQNVILTAENKRLQKLLVEGFDIIARDYPDVMTAGTRISNWKMSVHAALEGGE